MGRRHTKAAGGGLKPTHGLSAQRTGPYRLIAQDVSQRIHISLGNQKSIFENSPRSLGAITVMDYGLVPDGDVEAKRGGSVPSPSSHRYVCDCFDNHRGLTRVKEALAGLFIDIGCRFHSGILRSRCQDVMQNFSKPFKALPGLLVARDAGAALTGSVPAVNSQDENTSNPSWLPPHDAEFWGACYDEAEQGYDE